MGSRLIIALRIALLGLVAAVAIAQRAHISAALGGLAALHPIVVLAFPLFCLWNLAAARGWLALRWATMGHGEPSLWRLWTVRLEAQALNLVVPLGSVGGEVLRTTLTSPSRDSTPRSALAVALDNIASVVAGVGFTILGVVYHWSLVPSRERLALAIGIMGAVVLALAGVWGLPALLARYRRRIPARWGGGDALATLLAAKRRLAVAFGRSVLWHVAERLLTAVEIYLIIVALGVPASPVDALFATAVMTGMSLVFFFVPAQLGASELGIVASLGAVGISVPVALSVALARRARQLVVGAVGIAILLAYEGRRSPAAQEPGGTC